jgi:hypothetical protein
VRIERVEDKMKVWLRQNDETYARHWLAEPSYICDSMLT